MAESEEHWTKGLKHQCERVKNGIVQSERIVLDNSPVFDASEILKILTDRTWTFLENQTKVKLARALRILADEDSLISWYPWNHLSVLFLTTRKNMLNVLSTK